MEDYSMDERILNAAREEIRIHGLKFTMDDITKRLHISKTSLYNAVGSKDKLVAALVHTIMDNYNRREQAIMMGKDSTIIKMKQLILVYTETFSRYDNNVFLDVQVMYPDIWQEWLNYQNSKIEAYINILKQGISEGEVKSINTVVIQKCLISSMKVLNDYEFLQNNGITYGEAVEAFLNVIFNGLKK